MELCRLLRARLIDTVSRTGGHLASSLGAVELIVAIHRVFDTGRDRLVFDVGHQCYAHKILTGRNQAMETLRTFGGIAGFPKPVESESDAFVAGHASNSVSVAIGMARARTLQHADYHVLALIGDGASSKANSRVCHTSDDHPEECTRTAHVKSYGYTGYVTGTNTHRHGRTERCE